MKTLLRLTILEYRNVKKYSNHFTYNMHYFTKFFSPKVGVNIIHDNNSNIINMSDHI